MLSPSLAQIGICAVRGLYFFLIQVSQVQELKELKKLSLPMVAEELRQ